MTGTSRTSPPAYLIPVLEPTPEDPARQRRAPHPDHPPPPPPGVSQTTAPGSSRNTNWPLPPSAISSRFPGGLSRSRLRFRTVTDFQREVPLSDEHAAQRDGVGVIHRQHPDRGPADRGLPHSHASPARCLTR